MEAADASPIGGRASTRDKVQAALEKRGVKFSSAPHRENEREHDGAAIDASGMGGGMGEP